MAGSSAVAKGLPAGLYERLIYDDETALVDEMAAAHCAVVSQPSQAQRREHLIDEVAARLPELLDAISSGSDVSAEQARAEVKLIADMLRVARQEEKSDASTLAEPLRLLRAVHAPNVSPIFPQTGLRRPWIFTSARSDPSLLNELRAELGNVDRVDILVSFITWSGVRKLIDVLKLATAVDARGTPRTRFRILTTTYIGATEVRAVDALAELPGVELRIHWMDDEIACMRRPGYFIASLDSALLSSVAQIYLSLH
jgi:hypothetical protein